MLCEYKNLFGKVGEGIHSYRIFDIAIVDTLLTIFAGFTIYLFFPNYGFFYILLFLFILGIALHHIFCVRTTIDKLLFP